jgi:hypothetical protein
VGGTIYIMPQAPTDIDENEGSKMKEQVFDRLVDRTELRQ